MNALAIFVFFSRVCGAPKVSNEAQRLSFVFSLRAVPKLGTCLGFRVSGLALGFQVFAQGSCPRFRV